MPALDAQEFGNLAVTITSILLGQPDESEAQCIVIPGDGLVLLGAAGKADDPAGPPLRRGQLLPRVDNGLTKVVRRQALGFR